MSSIFLYFQIKEELVERYGAVEGYVVVACYLISAGADINQGNDTIMGTIKPLDLCSPQHKMMIEAYVQSRQLQQKKNSQEESEEGRGSGEKVGERDKNEETQSEEDDGYVLYICRVKILILCRNDIIIQFLHEY